MQCIRYVVDTGFLGHQQPSQRRGKGDQEEEGKEGVSRIKQEIDSVGEFEPEGSKEGILHQIKQEVDSEDEVIFEQGGNKGFLVQIKQEIDSEGEVVAFEHKGLYQVKKEMANEAFEQEGE